MRRRYAARLRGRNEGNPRTFDGGASRPRTGGVRAAPSSARPASRTRARGGPRPSSRTRRVSGRSPCWRARPRPAPRLARSAGVSSPLGCGRRALTRASSARASSAQPDEPISAKAASARSSDRRAAPHFRCRRCARPSASSDLAGIEAEPEQRRTRPTACVERSDRLGPSYSLASSTIPSQRFALASPHGCSCVLGQHQQAVSDTARASSSSPSSTSASTRSGATGKTPGSSTPTRCVCAQTSPQALDGSRWIVREQCGRPAGPQRFEPVPADIGLVRAGDRLRRPSLRLVGKTAARRQERAAPLVHRPDQQTALGRTRPTRRAGAPPPSHAPARELELAQVEPRRARTRPARPARRPMRASGRSSTRARPADRARRAAGRRRDPASPGGTRPRPTRSAESGPQISRSGDPRRLRAQARA